jgi:PE-PPE domain
VRSRQGGVGADVTRTLRHQREGFTDDPAKAFAYITAVGIIAAVAGAATIPTARADSTLVPADGPLSGSDTAIIVGGTIEPTPSTAFAQTAENLYLQPLGFDDSASFSAVCDVSGTDPCGAPLQVLTTPELLQQGPSALTGASDIVQAVKNELANNPGAFGADHPLTVFGYSQGAEAESLAMTQLAQDGVPSDELHFVFIGDPSAPDGIWANVEPDLDALVGPNNATAVTNLLDPIFGLKDAVGVLTPDDLYPTTVYTLAGDAVADFQADYNSGGLLGILGGIAVHASYLGLTASEIADASTSVSVDVAYVDLTSPFDELSAITGALDNGLLSSGLFQSLFDSFEYALHVIF